MSMYFARCVVANRVAGLSVGDTGDSYFDCDPALAGVLLETLLTKRDGVDGHTVKPSSAAVSGQSATTNGGRSVARDPLHAHTEALG